MVAVPAILRRSIRQGLPTVGLAIFSALLMGGWSTARCQDPIVLRDLTIIRGKSITNFDETDVRLSDGSSLPWYQILKARVDGTRQAVFDEYIANLGLPMFRIRTRISNQDWSGMSELAEPLYADLGLEGLQSTDTSEFTYLVCLATGRGRLYRGDRPDAVLPFLQAARIQRLNKNLADKSQRYLPTVDSDQMLSSEILPIWFEHSKVEQAFSSLEDSFVPTAAPEQAEAIIYLASMAIEMNKLELARDLVKLIGNRNDQIESWRLILLAQIKMSENDPEEANRLLDENSSKLKGATAAVASYLKSRSGCRPKGLPDASESSALKAEPQERSQILKDRCGEAMLELLRIPANYGELHPVLSAAALYQTAQIAKSQGWSKEEQILKQELLLRFPSTYHGRIVENGLRTDQDQKRHRRFSAK